MYWSRGDDEVVLTDDEIDNSRPAVADLFSISSDIFSYETPLCAWWKEFNQLQCTDPELLTSDIAGERNFEEYKNDWLYMWNNDVPWVEEKPWGYNYCISSGTNYNTQGDGWRTWNETHHTCPEFIFKDGRAKWPTCNSNSDGFCNGGELPGMVRIGSMTYFQDIEWYDNLVDCKAKEEALEFKRSHELSLGSSMISVKQFRNWVKQCFYDFHDLEPSLLI